MKASTQECWISIRSVSFAILLFLAPTWALGASLTALLSQSQRPSLQAVHESRAELEADPKLQAGKLDPRVQQLMEEAPRLIAELESVYPGATWALLGRDSAFLADILEAYYLSQGETGRVVRLDASGASFKTPGVELDFLKSNGLELDTANRPRRPYVVIDATSWRGQIDKGESQSRKLVESLFAITPEGRRRDLLERLNVIGQGAASNGKPNGRWIKELSNDQVRGFLQKVPVGKAGPAQILYVSPVFSYGYWDWHDTFGPLTRDESGRVIAQPGALSEEATRISILKSMLETAKTVTNPSFFAAVKTQAQMRDTNIEAIQKYRYLLDDERFGFWASQRSWSLAAIDDWEKSLNGVPRGLGVTFSERWWDLVLRGLSTGAIAETDFSTLAMRLAELSKLSPGLLYSVVASFQTPERRGLPAFKEFVLNPPQAKIPGPWATLLWKVAIVHPELVSPDTLKKSVANTRAILESIVHSQAESALEFLSKNIDKLMKLGGTTEDYLAVLHGLPQSPETKQTLKNIEHRIVEHSTDIRAIVAAAPQLGVSILWRVMPHADQLNRDELLTVWNNPRSFEDREPLAKAIYSSAKTVPDFLTIAEKLGPANNTYRSHLFPAAIAAGADMKTLLELREKYIEKGSPRQESLDLILKGARTLEDLRLLLKLSPDPIAATVLDARARQLEISLVERRDLVYSSKRVTQPELAYRILLRGAQTRDEFLQLVDMKPSVWPFVAKSERQAIEREISLATHAQMHLLTLRDLEKIRGRLKTPQMREYVEAQLAVARSGRVKLAQEPAPTGGMVKRAWSRVRNVFGLKTTAKSCPTSLVPPTPPAEH